MDESTTTSPETVEPATTHEPMKFEELAQYHEVSVSNDELGEGGYVGQVRWFSPDSQIGVIIGLGFDDESAEVARKTALKSAWNVIAEMRDLLAGLDPDWLDE